jgi:cardiolipin synthase
MNVTIVLLFTEILLFIAFFRRFVEFLPMIASATYVLGAFIILFLVKKNEPPAYKTSWLIIVFALPILGALLFILFRHDRSTRKMKRRFAQEREQTARHLEPYNYVLDDNNAPNRRITDSLRYIQNVSAYPVYQNTSVKYYPLGELMFEDMLTALAGAEKFIFLEYFIISRGKMWEQILTILIAKAEAGVDVRLIYDDLGSAKLFSTPYRRKLRRGTKIKIAAFNPIVPWLAKVMNNRDHRKIMVIDGSTAFCGGINIADEYINEIRRFGAWKDNGIRLNGSAVWSLTLMFCESWNVFCRRCDYIGDRAVFKGEHEQENGELLEQGFIQPYGCSPFRKERLGENVYIEILNQAKRYVHIFTPYLIISEKMSYAIQMAAKRGIDVKIFTPGVPDKRFVYRLSRSYYRDLIEAGARICEYTPGFLHGKAFISDDETAIVGTINLNYRSLYLDFECAVLFHDSGAVQCIREDAAATMADVREVSLADCRRSFGGELLDSILRLYAPLM